MKRQFLHENHNRQDKRLKSDYREDLAQSQRSDRTWTGNRIGTDLIRASRRRTNDERDEAIMYAKDMLRGKLSDAVKKKLEADGYVVSAVVQALRSSAGNVLAGANIQRKERHKFLLGPPGMFCMLNFELKHIEQSFGVKVVLGPWPEPIAGWLNRDSFRSRPQA